jgi:hypothetical protein
VSNTQKQFSAKRAWSILSNENRMLRAALEKIEALTASRSDALSRTIHRIAAGAIEDVRATRDRAA